MMSNSDDCNGNAAAAAAKAAYEDYDLKHIFRVSQQILVRREPGEYYRADNNPGFFTGILDQYGSTISDVSRQMTCKLNESEDEKTYKILKGTLRNHSWKAKMVIAVAALALKCGKHLIIPSELPDLEKRRKSSEDNQIIKSIWLLQRLHIISDHLQTNEAAPLQPLNQWLTALADFVLPMMKLTEFILYELRDDQIPEDDIQWIIKSAVVCSSQITLAHFLLLSNRQNLFTTHALKLNLLTETVEKTSKHWERAQVSRH
ncbi:uncharacterized protein LOC116011226 [Ipomoea triloba]|uniref:uncharacterized protein LOC116011226 n=1 Tax=Ipomoea triloba TaxID=35885 RepID=UPI00125D53C8|nr:uncharacterized protein LOC116011226 [Ipomoea triloba]